MQKRNLVYLMLGIFLISISSCNDFLEYSESSILEEEMAFSNIGRATRVGLNSYTYMQDNFGGSMRSSGIDESQYVWPTNSIHRYYNGSWSAFATIDDRWGHFYNGINACNNFLENGADLTFDEYKYDENFQNAYTNFQNLKWEVRALRAYYHFELVKRYGDIPLVTNTLTIDEANSVTQSSAKDVIKWIANEYQTCYQHLPDSYDYTGNPYSGQAGRITKLFVKALESRALLYGASPLYNDGAYDLELLRSSAKASLNIIEEMEGKGVSLKNIAYNDLWNSDGDTHVKTPSIISAIRKGATNSFEKENFPISVEGGNTGNTPTQNLVDAYGMQSGFEYNPEKPYSNRDERLLQTVVVNQSVWAYNQTMNIYNGGSEGQPNKGASPTGYYLKKFAMQNTNLKPSGTTEHKMIWILFRLGEVYLNYAEAASQINGVSGTDGDLNLSAVDAINKVRSRKGLNIDPISSNLSLSDFIGKYRNERMIELAFEDHRFWDIRRWKIGPSTVDIKIMNIESLGDKNFKYTVKSDYGKRYWDDKYYFYPINQNELDINENLKQNKGW